MIKELRWGTWGLYTEIMLGGSGEATKPLSNRMAPGVHCQEWNCCSWSRITRAWRSTSQRLLQDQSCSRLGVLTCCNRKLFCQLSTIIA